MGADNSKEPDCFSMVIGRPRKKKFKPIPLSSAHADSSEIALSETEHASAENFQKIEQTLSKLKTKIEYTEQVVEEKRREFKKLAEEKCGKMTLLNKLKFVRLQEAHLSRLYDTVDKIEVAKIELEQVSMTGMVSNAFEGVYTFTAKATNQFDKEKVIENMEQMGVNMDKLRELDDVLQANNSSVVGEITERDLERELAAMYDTEPPKRPKEKKEKKEKTKPADTILIEMDEEPPTSTHEQTTKTSKKVAVGTL